MNATTKNSGELIVPPGYKPIKKKKLYNFKPDDDTKLLKRKRVPPPKRGISDPRVPAIASNASVQPKKIRQQGPRPLSVPNALSVKPPTHRAPEEWARLSSFRSEMGSQRSPLNGDSNHSLESASIAESPINLMNADLERDHLM